MSESNDMETVKSDKDLGEVEDSRKIPTSNSSTSSSLAVTPKLTESELQSLDYSDFSTPARMMQLGEALAKSKLVPLKTKEDVTVALMTGKELGLPFISSLSNIYPINGRPTLGVHLQKALLIKGKVIFNKVEDYVPLYKFVFKDKDGKVEDAGIGSLEEQPEGSLKSKQPVDYRTTYEFIREIKMQSGKYRELTTRSSFTMLEAQEADLLEKDVWVKYRKRMLDARAFTIGAREVADDLLLGLMTREEAGDDYVEDVQATVIN